MKASIHLAIIAAGLFVTPLRAQTDAGTPAPAADAPAPVITETTTPGSAIEPTSPATTAIEPTSPGGLESTGTEALSVGDDGVQESEEGFIIKDAGLNDIFQFLAKSAGRQYFHNSKIAGPEYLVTGHLNDGEPLQQMEELAFMYGLSLHVKGNTIYALTQSQLSQLPSSEFHYQLRYLRPSDAEGIKDLIRPVLSPTTGIVNFEPKTNTIIIIDSTHRIEAAKRLLEGIDKPKGQIIVETKILRVNSTAAERTGVDWSSALGADGGGLQVSSSLNAVFGFDASEKIADANLVLSPGQLSGVLRALAEGNLATQVSNPTLITEDNERATISIIDRIPIITTQQTATSGSDNPTVTEEVRYKIDESDKSIDTDPESHREIGISLVVTPTVLPDGTIRMKMRPRSAQITEFTPGYGGFNQYPNVTESMIETLARIPDGHSLVVGGFYGLVDNDNKNKVPLLGDIPVLNFFFKSKETIKEKSSLVFIVTPTSYDPRSSSANSRSSSMLRSAASLSKDHNWVDHYNPGPAHEPNLPRAIRGLQPSQAPYYPRAKAVNPAP